MLFTSLDLASITSHIHNWVLFSLWLHPFILSGIISSLISSRILGIHRPGEFIFQCPIFLPFHSVHGILKARILKWFAIPFSGGPHSVRNLHQSPILLGWPHKAWLSFIYAEYITRNAGLEETQAGIRIAGRNITSDLQMTPPLWQKVKN